MTNFWFVMIHECMVMVDHVSFFKESFGLKILDDAVYNEVDVIVDTFMIMRFVSLKLLIYQKYLRSQLVQKFAVEIGMTIL
mgnify:CR=1 FL=1